MLNGTKCFSVLCLWLVAAAFTINHVETTRADDAVDARPTVEELRALIMQLGEPKYRDREQAESRLAKVGLTAIELLQEHSSHENLEIRMRVRRLIGSLRSGVIQDAIPEDLKDSFEDYDQSPEASRQERINELKTHIGEGHFRLLGRLTRFEESELLAKRAALVLLKGDPEEHPGGQEAVRKEIAEGIELSTRAPSNWVRLYSESMATDEPKKVVDKLRGMVRREREALDRFDKNTDEEIVLDLSRIVVTMQLRSGLRDDALREVETLMADADPDPKQAHDLLDWLDSQEILEPARTLFKKNEALFNEDAMLLYKMATFEDRLGDKEKAKEIADRAFGLAGQGLADHEAWHRKRLLTFERLVEVILRSPDRKDAQRYLMAMTLEDEFGQIEWAEREYRELLKLPVQDKGNDGKPLPMSVFQARANISMSEMLHDRQRERDAADCLKSIVDAGEESKEFTPGSFFRPDWEGIKSRMYFFSACDLEQKKKYEEQRKELMRAIEQEPTDVDVLIGMYRAPESPDEWKEDVETRIRSACIDFEKDLKEYRAKFVVQPGNEGYKQQIALNENQFAWLVGNTVGDIDRAIAYSKHSLVLFPGEGGYLDTLGRCYYRKGDFKSAMQSQRQAVKAAPHEMQIRRQLELIESAAAAESSEQ